MWYAYEGEWMNWHKITTEQANEIIAANRQNKPIVSLEEYALDLAEDTTVEFENVVGQDSLTRFDSPKRSKKRRTNRRKNNQNKGNSNTGGAKKNANSNANKTKAPTNANAKPNKNKRRRNTKRKPQNAKNNQK
jgi:hypothetical protein